MLSYEPEAQTSSDGRMLLEMPTTPKMFCAVTLRKPPKCPRPPKKKFLVTLRWLAICPCPRLLVRLRYVAESCPSVAYTTVIKINIFWGELTDNSAIKEALLLRLPFTKKSSLNTLCGLTKTYIKPSAVSLFCFCLFSRIL